ncbi:Gfo/Idh/MocA family protein [Chitinophaga qingshengii]|uniref:Gfo/Idh/MocA family oxidoreductase n=1 Tax=Chitinophaga qingshengii TaxID=1569794 RepID=A0ABR7TVB4_9BACT|nr:Gfo/Idh/MocA family oxidoreductase [Chitinophaga qingshengii]MBC9934403.1 Gfo/Idh/MocA family oxidoreductase [Chitinophaga qingshengii]
MTHSRRDFLRSASTLAAGAGLVTLLPAHLRAVAPSDRVRIAAIGINGMGWSDLTAMLKHPAAQCVALCDADRNVLDKRAGELSQQGIKAKTYNDYRKLLEDKSIDAVIIGTPDHWHCLQMTDACAAGKDVYVEKPVGNSIVECRAMVAAQQRYNRAVQVGQWQRSQQHFKDAVDFVHSGKLGQVRLVKAWAYMGWMKSIPVQPDGTPPAGVDYKAWLGPAKERPFNPNRFHFNFRWYWDYAGGLMTDWGVHLLDYALLGMKAETPKSVMAAGGKFAYPDDAAETPDTLTTVYEFDGFNIQWEQAQGINGGPYGRDHGIAFIGNNGTLVLDRGGWEVIPEKDKMEAVPRQKAVDNGLTLHTQNFIDVVRSRKFGELHTPVQAGAHIATTAQMGNIAFRTGKKLNWDKHANQFTDSDANQLLAAGYHNGYKLPSFG